MGLKQIKNKIESTKKTGKVTKAMEAVSAVKMRKTQERALQGRPYVYTALRTLKRLSQSTDALMHPLMQQRTEGRTLLIIVTSDKGLAGSVNSAVLKQAEHVFREQPETDVIAVGKKAVDFAHRLRKNVIGEYTNLSDNVTIADVYEMSALATSSFTDGSYAKIIVTYQNFISTFEQRPTTRQILPLSVNEIRDVMENIKPKTGKYSEEKPNVEANISYTIEPSAEEVLNVLIPQLVQIVLYHALIESKACEHSARMVAMKSATDKTKDFTKALTLEYNKVRQSVITAEVSEITGGIEALKT
ncbi:MAG: ATP synthase F1 subunit gamma [Candidatus Paceibacterota bacterium]